jgi:hypothetical protein
MAREIPQRKGVDMPEKTKMVIVSYVPLLYGAGGEKIDVSTDGLKKLTDNLSALDRCGQIKACLWSKEDYSPVFVMPHAKEVAGHLSMWAEGSPQEWFEVCILDKDDVYFIILWPNLEKSKDRHLYNWMIRNSEMILEDDVEMSFIFRPIYFRSKNRGMIDQVLGIIKDRKKINVGFVDQADVDMKHPLNTQAEPYYVGAFPLRFEHKQADAYCDSMLRSEKEEK